RPPTERFSASFHLTPIRRRRDGTSNGGLPPLAERYQLLAHDHRRGGRGRGDGVPARDPRARPRGHTRAARADPAVPRAGGAVLERGAREGGDADLARSAWAGRGGPSTLEARHNSRGRQASTWTCREVGCESRSPVGLVKQPGQP